MSQTVCSRIAADILVNCTNPVFGGTQDTLWIINYDDYNNAVITYNTQNPLIIENIVLPSAAKAYMIQGQDNSNLPKQTMLKKGFSRVFDHQVEFKTFSLNPTVKAQLEGVLRGKFVVICENVYKGDNGEAAFEVYGTGAGLICSKLDRDPGSADTQGVYDIILKTSDKASENHFPLSYFKTSYAATLALIQGITA